MVIGPEQRGRQTQEQGEGKQDGTSFLIAVPCNVAPENEFTTDPILPQEHPGSRVRESRIIETPLGGEGSLFFK